MNTEFETNFTVMPKHANYMYPMIFGGAFYSEIDLCAAVCVNRFLNDSDCESSVTHRSEVTYLAPCYVGDIIYLKSKIVSAGKKSIVVEVNAERESRGSTERDKVARGLFVFVAIEHTRDVQDKPKRLPYKNHGLKLS
jgi:acyl-CoA hydrolase